MGTLNKLWSRIVNFFSELSKPILFLATCSVFLFFIIASQIAHSTKELKYLGEIVKQERLILELEEGLGWQNEVMTKQHEAIQNREVMLEYYKSVIQELMMRLNKKLEEERPKRSEATNHEKRIEYKNMGPKQQLVEKRKEHNLGN